MTTTEKSRADALTDEHLATLKQAALTVTPQDIDGAERIESRPDGSYITCPACEGEGCIPFESDYCNYDHVAIGVQFYGIGTEPGAAEAYFRAAKPATIIALLDRLERAESALAASPVEQPAAAPIDEPVAAWINYPVKTVDGEFAGYEKPELSFARAAYGYDYAKAEPLYRRAPAPSPANNWASASPAPSPAHERAAFEAYMTKKGYVCKTHMGGYVSGDVASKWDVWQARAASANETGAEGTDAFAHEVWSAAQRASGEGIEDAVQRIAAILSRSHTAAAEAAIVGAWIAEDDRAITAAQKQRALDEGGATASAVRPYSIPCYVAAPQPAQADAQDVPADDLVGFVYVLENPDRPHDPVTRFSRRPLGVRSLGAKIVSLTPVYSRPAQVDDRVGLTDEQRESVDHAATWLDRSEDLQNKAHAERLRALLQGANHAE